MNNSEIDMWRESTGKIIYDPHRPGMKRKTQWWCVVPVDREITRYYRWLITREVPGLALHPPAWDAHISVIRGEKPDDDKMHLWRKYHKQKVTFWYSHYVRRNGHFWFVEVRCPGLIEIRREMDKPADWSLHLTVGRTWDNDTIWPAEEWV